MKKIFAISLIAMTAVTAANAEIASKAYVDQERDVAKAYTDTKIGNIDGADVAAAIAAAVQGGTENAVTRSGSDAVGSATVPVYVNASGVVTPTTLGTMALEAAGDYTKTADLNTTFATDAELTAGLATKQDTLTTAQQNAVDSGITSTLVGKITTNESAITTLNGDAQTAGSVDAKIAAAQSDLQDAIDGKQDTLTTAQQAAVDSGITSTLVGKITTNESAITTLNGDAQTAGSVDAKIATATSGMLTTSNYGTTLDAVYEPINAASTAIAALDDTSGAAQAGKWVTAVTQTDGKITATMADPLAAFTQLSANQGDGVYALTATASNGTITGYKWEMIQRASGN